MTTTSASRTVQRHLCKESNALVDVVRRGLDFLNRMMPLQRKAEYRDLTFIEFTLNQNGKAELTDSVAVVKAAAGHQLTM
jgi:hypothetical protein